MINRKAQLSMFFLLGILMIAVFATISYINSRQAEIKLTGPSEKIITDLLKSGSVPYYVELCLEKHSAEALELVGKQGGNIYWSQYGPAPNPTNFLYIQSDSESSNMVSYGISAPVLQDGTLYPPPPSYPGGYQFTSQVPDLKFEFAGRFGERSLRRLCDVNGSNSPFYFDWSKQKTYVAGDSETYKGSVTVPLCLYDNYEDFLSSQYQMEFYVEKTLKNCTNWTAIKEETGYNVTPAGAPDVVFRLGMSDVWVDAYFPLRIDVGGTEPVYTVADFHTRFPVRLKKIVEMAALMANYDSFYLKWNLSSYYKGFYGWDSLISVYTSTPYKKLGVWDDIITIMDLGSTLNGKPYIYRFARENRFPALDYIHVSDAWDDYDVVGMEQEPLFINPNPPDDLGLSNLIYDPDEDNLTYYYTGWKETCDEPFDFERGVPTTQGCSVHEPTHPKNYFEFPNQGIKVLKDGTSGAFWGLSYITTSIIKGVDLLNWTSSYAYRVSGRNASIIPSDDDIGPHNVTVWVCDEGGLCDYQVVRILVIDYPELHLNGSNPYQGIPYNRASVEDPYRFSAEGTTAYYSPLLGYVFSDKIEPFDIIVKHPNQVVEIPQQPPMDSRDLLKIPEYNFSRDKLDGEVYKNHTIELSLVESEVLPEKFNVSVYQCLPYYDPSRPFPWPYNNSPDAFFSSHVCCSPGESITFNINYPEDTVDDVWSIENTFYGDDLYLVKVVNSTGNIVGLLFNDGSHPEISCLEKNTFTPKAPSFNTKSNSGFGTFKTTTPPSDSRIPPNPLPVCVFAPKNKTIKIIFKGYSVQARGGGSFSQSGAPEGNYSIIISSKSDSVPEWGAWFDSDHRCFSSGYRLGFYDKLKENFDPLTSSFLPPPKDKIIAGESSSSPPAIENDIVVSSFDRFCSGDRGNVCTGTATQTFTRVKDCKNRNKDVGEVENCMGPSNEVFSSPDYFLKTSLCRSNADCPSGQCSKDGYCYTPGDLDCKAYSGTSFEKAFGLKKRGIPSNIPADGICNPRPACGDEYTYDASLSEGAFLHSSAKCSSGDCSAPVKSVDCDDFSGCSEFQEIKFGQSCKNKGCKLNVYKNQLESTFFQCAKSDTEAKCSFASYKDGDFSEGICSACNEVHNKLNKGPVWLGDGGQSNCCGDDIGEGGFIYGKEGVHKAKSSINDHNAGNYQKKEVCSDYYEQTTVYNPWTKKYEYSLSNNPIDNDCDGKYNCEDNDCNNFAHYSSARMRGFDAWSKFLGERSGSSASVCCNSETQCKKFLDPSGSSSEGVECSLSNHQCDCKPVNGVTNNPKGYINGMDIKKNPIRTCVPPLSEVYIETNDYVDRFISVPDDVDCKSIDISSYDIDQDSSGEYDCKEAINCVSKTKGILKFQNYATEDCLVEIKIK